ncbi:MAG: hypothetical protein AAGI23_15305 [Bacteroidota bacterium]
MIIVDGNLVIEAGQDYTLHVQNSAAQALVLDFSSRQALLYFLGFFNRQTPLLQHRRPIQRALRSLHQDFIITIDGKTAIYRRKGARRFIFRKDLKTTLAILWLLVRTSLFQRK